MGQSATHAGTPASWRPSYRLLGLTLILLILALALTAGAFAFVAGDDWSAQSSGTTSWLMAVSFVDASHGWAVGTGGTILATSDGGATWTAQRSGTSQALEGVAFVDASHGWAVGTGGTILATTNGGATWSAQSRAPTTSSPP